jgi:hypothetical protein
MGDRLGRLARVGLWAIPLWAALLLVGTLTHQPNYRTDFAGYARYVTTPGFLASHVVASILGAGVGVVGIAALAAFLANGRGGGAAVLGFVLFALASVLLASVFGAAAFAQPAIGRAFLAGNATAVALNDDVYGTPLFTVAASAILLFSVGLGLAGIGAARSGRFPKAAAIALAVSGPFFALGNIALPDWFQTLASAVMLVASAWMAWTPGRGAPAA